MPRAPDLSGHALNDRYELHAVIGEGAFGRVYRAWDQRLERRVAVKLIKPWWAEDPDWAQSFEREARLLARISHPGIVQIFDVGQADEGLYYVSELVDGDSLAHRLADGLPDPWTAAALTEQICRALAQAHAKNVIHRDVKPANILISEDGRVKVGDFGVARLAEGSSDGASATIVGTPRYMAPEQARGLRSTPATDVYSVGVVLYEMLAGTPPFTERSAVELALRHLRDKPPPLPSGTPAGIDEIVTRALAKEPAKRYADGAAMADALARARTAGTRERSRSSRRTRARRSAPVASGAWDAGADTPARRSPRPSRNPAHHEPPTRRAPRFNPRRNLNPAARRRSIAALAFAFAVLGAMIAAAIVLSPSTRVRAPSLLGLTRSGAQTRANRLALQTTFSRRYSDAPKGTAVAQAPRAHTRVREGSTVHVWLSAGRRPVIVPELAGDQFASAKAQLAQRGLTADENVGPAPGVPAGTVTSQSPAPGSKLAPPKRVTLNVAEAPQWRALTSFDGSGQPTSTSFRIRGSQWRIVYTMSYQGTCTFIFWCSGPQAEVDRVSGGATLAAFGLNDGGRQARVFSTGPGVYRLSVSPGADSAGWRVWVEDDY
jgi:eukaryotic-like serine/threonine-protein kinase